MTRKRKTQSAKPDEGPVTNRYNVPTRTWNTWVPEAQALFNEVYGEIVKAQNVLAPPSFHSLSPRAWQVMCWNIMWMATDKANTKLKK